MKPGDVTCLDCSDTVDMPELTAQFLYWDNGELHGIRCANCRKRYVCPPNIEDYK